MSESTLKLPKVRSEAEFDAFMQDSQDVRRALDQLVRHLELHGRFEVSERGSAIVGLSDDEVLKVMAPYDVVHARTERTCLEHLHERLPVPTPELLACGEIDGWQWTLMRRLGGHELVDVWPGLDHVDRLALASQLGAALAALHSVEAPEGLERVDWPAWVDSRVASLIDDQRQKGCPPELLDGLKDFVTRADLDAGRSAWLHTEVMQEHLLVEQTDAGWDLSGLFDFEPSWVGPVDYEFAAVGLFVSAGDPRVLGRVLSAAGSAASPDRLFAMAMMHRYANLGWYHRRLGGPLNVEDLAQRWFGHN